MTISPLSPVTSLPPSDLPYEDEEDCAAVTGTANHRPDFLDDANLFQLEDEEDSAFSFPSSPSANRGNPLVPNLLSELTFNTAQPLGLRSRPARPPPTPYRQRASSLPPMSTPSREMVEPALNKQERQKRNRKDGAAKAVATRLAAVRAEARLSGEREQERISSASRDVLAYMEERELSFGHLVDHVFDPENKLFQLQWDEFFRDRRRIPRLLDWWTSPASNSNTGQRQVTDWAVGFVEKMVGAEAREVTKLGLGRKAEIDDELVSVFDIESWYNKLRYEVASVTTRIFDAISTSARQIKNGMSVPRQARKKMTVVTSIMSCLSEYSLFNNIFRRVFGLYLYATGAQRQLITVLSHIGITESWTKLVGGVGLSTVTTDSISVTSTTPTNTQARRRTPGTLQQLSTLMRTKSRGLSELVTYGSVYDNVNFTERVGEQIIGRSNSVESATAATIWPLHKANKEDMKIEDLEKGFNEAEPLLLSDILHTPEEKTLFNKCLVHCILRIVVAHGGPGFKKFKAELDKALPKTKDAIDVHKTELHPLPTWKIDESTIVGNAEVIEALTKELHLRNQSSSWMKYVRIIAGDQLSIARLRALASMRAGHEDKESSFTWGVWMPGLFHAKIADMHGFFVTHWGKPNAGVRNPGCLAFHNTLLRNHPISITSLPAFRTCRDLVFVSLYARILHCLLEVSEHATLEDYCKNVDTWEEFHRHGCQVLDNYANSDRHAKLYYDRGPPPPKDNKGSKSKRTTELPPLPKKGDMVLENAILFLRDALISREFTDAVKSGDSGRVVLVLKIWALSFRGNGRTKYAYEMLSILHNLQKVWPKPIASIVLNNWLLNPTGRPNSFVEVDLVQEHMNFWIKTFYKARGSNSSWEWLEMISPCIQALRHLCTVMKDSLGTNNGSRHAPADLSRDISTLMDSLRMHNVYGFEEGRQLDPDDPPTVDVVTVGLHSIHGPLSDYNDSFERMKERRRTTPAVDVNENQYPSPPADSGNTQPDATDPSSLPSDAASNAEQSQMSDLS